MNLVEEPKSGPEKATDLFKQHMAREEKRRKGEFFWWLIPRLIAVVVMAAGVTVLCVWTFREGQRQARIQCLEYNGPLLNACIDNCKLSPKMSIQECNEFCMKTTCKRWTQ